MDEFSIDLSAERIVDPRTKEYFSEVMSSYMNGSYRSSVVMLWSVAVCDLVYKLQALRDLYQDQVATGILQSIEAKQQQNPNSPDWESWLVEEVNVRMHLFEAADYQSLIHLQKIRHLSAHPVLSGANLLFSPSKESVRALIRSTMEGLLLKPPVFSKKIVGEFVQDIASKKDLLPDDVALQKYLQAKYFKYLHKAVEEELVKALWKFSFRIENADTIANRDINVRCLRLLFARNQVSFRSLVERNTAYFSEISPESGPLIALSDFFYSAPSIFSVLSDAAKTIYSNFARANPRTLARSPYISPDAGSHLGEIDALSYESKRKLKTADWESVLTSCAEEPQRQKFFKIAASVYCASTAFDPADTNFSVCVKPFVSGYSRETIEEIIGGIEGNSQAYWRSRAKTDHPLIKARAIEVGLTNFDVYPNFARSLPDD